MSETHTPNGIEAWADIPPRLDLDAVRVRFGPSATQVIPLRWAEIMLTRLKVQQPLLFGKLLTAASDGGE